MVYAQGVKQVIGTINPGPMGNLNFSGVVSWGISLFFIGAAMFAFFQLLMGALDWVASGGEEKKLEGARSRMTSAGIGLALTIIVFVGWNFLVGPILGVFKDGQIQLPTINSLCVQARSRANAISDCCSGSWDPATQNCL